MPPPTGEGGGMFPPRGGGGGMPPLLDAASELLPTDKGGGEGVKIESPGRGGRGGGFGILPSTGTGCALEPPLGGLNAGG